MRRTQTARNLETKMGAAVLLAAALLVLPWPLRAEKLTTQTEEAFLRYVYAREVAMDIEVARGTRFLWLDTLAGQQRDQVEADLRNGRAAIEQDLVSGQLNMLPVPGGLIHDWTGIVFIPGVSIPSVVSVLQDYDHAARYYNPQVLESTLLDRSGNDFRVLLRLKQVHVITIVLNTEYDVHYTFPDPAHVIARSYSKRIAEVENASTPAEREMPVGDDDGFLWRLYSYWRLYQAPDGVYLQCSAISLTRDVPVGLGWLIRPFLESIPRDSLRFTLESTRKAVISRVREQ